MSAELSVILRMVREVKVRDPLPTLSSDELSVMRVDFGCIVREESEREPVEEIVTRELPNPAERASVKALSEADPVERERNGCDAKKEPTSTVTLWSASPFTERVEEDTSTVDASLRCVPLFS